jgi:hypothetical protein
MSKIKTIASIFRSNKNVQIIQHIYPDTTEIRLIYIAKILEFIMIHQVSIMQIIDESYHELKGNAPYYLMIFDPLKSLIQVFEQDFCKLYHVFFYVSKLFDSDQNL